MGEVFGRLSSPAHLAHCGMTVEFPPRLVASGNTEDPEVWLEDGRADVCWKLAASLVSMRLRGMAWLLFGWPGLSAMLLDPAMACKLQLMAKLKFAVDAFEAACRQPQTPFMKALLRRSPFNTVPMKVLVQLARDTRFSSVSEVLLDWAVAAWSSVGQTKVVEDAFCQLRDVEGRGQKNTRIRHDRKWSTLVTQGLLDEKHGFSHETPQPAPRRGRESTNSLYTPLLETASCPELLKDLSGTKRKTEWVSFTAQSWANTFAEHAMLENCLAAGDFSNASFSWLSGMLELGLLVRQIPDGEWMLSMGSSQTMAVLCWPTVRHGRYFMPKPITHSCDIKWHTVFDLKLWEAMPTMGVSPLHAKLKEHTHGMLSIMILPTADPAPLHVVAARACFWRLPMQWLRHLQKYLGLEPLALAEASLFGYLKLLIKEVLQCTDTELGSILEQRLSSRVVEHEALKLLAEEGMQDNLEKGDARDLVTALGDHEKFEQEERLPYQKALRSFKVSVSGAAAASKRGRKAKAGQASSSSSGPQYPTKVPEGDVSLEMAKAWVPPGYTLRRVPQASRYDVYLKRGWSVSRSWRLYTPRVALLSVCGEAWRHHASNGGEPCPIAGLL